MRTDMSLARVIEFFSCFSILPVQIEVVCEQVQEQLRSIGQRKEIVFRPMDVSPEILLGMTLEYQDIDGHKIPSKKYYVVFFNSNVSSQQQRIICCKELVHLYDNGDTVTRTATDFSKLVDDVVKMPLTISSSIGTQGLADNIAIFYALAILFPDEARDDYRALFDADKVNYAEIAHDFDIPLKYVEFLMSSDWFVVRNMLIGCRAESSPR